MTVLLRASDAPGILTGWTGPVLRDVGDGEFAAGVAIPSEDPPTDGPVADMSRFILLDLTRPECADRAARWLAARVGLEVGATAPGWCHIMLDATGHTVHDQPAVGACWYLGHWFAFAAPGGPPIEHCRIVPALAALDPNDPTLTPSGARLVDLQALAASCVHVGRGSTPRAAPPWHERAEAARPVFRELLRRALSERGFDPDALPPVETSQDRVAIANTDTVLLIESYVFLEARPPEDTHVAVSRVLVALLDRKAHPELRKLVRSLIPRNEQ